MIQKKQNTDIFLPTIKKSEPAQTSITKQSAVSLFFNKLGASNEKIISANNKKNTLVDFFVSSVLRKKSEQESTNLKKKQFDEILSYTPNVTTISKQPISTSKIKILPENETHIENKIDLNNNVPKKDEISELKILPNKPKTSNQPSVLVQSDNKKPEEPTKPALGRPLNTSSVILNSTTERQDIVPQNVRTTKIAEEPTKNTLRRPLNIPSAILNLPTERQASIPQITRTVKAESPNNTQIQSQKSVHAEQTVSTNIKNKIESFFSIIEKNSKEQSHPSVGSLRNIKNLILEEISKPEKVFTPEFNELFNSFITISKDIVEGQNHNNLFINHAISKNLFNEIQTIKDEFKPMVTQLKQEIKAESLKTTSPYHSEFSLASFINSSELPLKSFNTDISEYTKVSEKSLDDIKNLFVKMEITHVEITNNQVVMPELSFDFKKTSSTSRINLSSLVLEKQTERANQALPPEITHAKDFKLFSKPAEYSSKAFSDVTPIIKKSLLTNEDKNPQPTLDTLFNTPEIVSIKIKSLQQTRNMEFIFDRIADEINKKASLPLSKLKVSFNPDFDTQATLIISGNARHKNIDVQIHSNNTEFIDLINTNKNDLISKIDSATQFTTNNISTLLIENSNSERPREGTNEQHSGKQQQQQRQPEKEPEAHEDEDT